MLTRSLKSLSRKRLWTTFRSIDLNAGIHYSWLDECINRSFDITGSPNSYSPCMKTLQGIESNLHGVTILLGKVGLDHVATALAGCPQTIPPRLPSDDASRWCLQKMYSYDVFICLQTTSLDDTFRRFLQWCFQTISSLPEDASEDVFIRCLQTTSSDDHDTFRRFLQWCLRTITSRKTVHLVWLIMDTLFTRSRCQRGTPWRTVHRAWRWQRKGTSKLVQLIYNKRSKNHVMELLECKLDINIK